MTPVNLYSSFFCVTIPYQLNVDTNTIPVSISSISSILLWKFYKLVISSKSPSVYPMYTTRSYIRTCILHHLLFIKLHNFSLSSNPIKMVLCSYIHACVVMLIYDLNTCYFWKYTLIYWPLMVFLFHIICFIIKSLTILLC